MVVPSLTELFLTFLRIGAIGFGGPFALVSLMEKVVVSQKGWMTTEAYAESTGMGSMTPGPISSSTAAVVGYRIRGWAGGILAYLGLHLPAVTLVIILAAYLSRVESLQIVRNGLKGLAAAVVGLLMAVGWKMGKNLIKTRKTFILTALAFVVLLLGVNPVFVVLGMGVVGYFTLQQQRGKA